jgi:hypothetical protein
MQLLLGVAVMYSFFILGQVPGTNIVISFTMWVVLAAALLLLTLWLHLKNRTIAMTTLEPTISAD